MKKLSSYLIAVCLCLFITTAHTQSLDKVLPVRAFCIAAPKPQSIERFVKFINEELPANKVNTLILRVDYHYQFENRPELREDSNSLSKQGTFVLIA